MQSENLSARCESALPSNHLLLPRREMLATLGFGAAALAGAGISLDSRALAQDQNPATASSVPMTTEAMGWNAKTNQYVLPPLPYAYDALEPHIDKQTMELHHEKHHAGYVAGLNRALQTLAELRKKESDPTELRNWLRELAFNGSGHFLHVLFWNSMGPNAGGPPKGNLAKEIDRCFGSFKQFADQFQAAAIAVEGGGWGILAWEPIGKQLFIMQAEKHQNLTAWGVEPILAVDVWEHAYYLKYQNKRKDYVAAFMNVINWNAADRRLALVAGPAK